MATIIAVIGGFLVFSQTNHPVVDAQADLQSAQANLVNDQAAVAQLTVLRVQTAKASQQLNGMPIGNLTQPAFVEYLSRLGRRHHVTINNVSFGAKPVTQAPVASTSSTAPGMEDKKGAPADTPAAPPAPVATAKPVFIEHPLKMDVSGAYRDVLFTVADLSRGSALVRVDSDPSLGASDKAGGGVSATVVATLMEIDQSVSSARKLRIQSSSALNGPQVFPGVYNHRTVPNAMPRPRRSHPQPPVNAMLIPRGPLTHITVRKPAASNSAPTPVFSPAVPGKRPPPDPALQTRPLTKGRP